MRPWHFARMRILGHRPKQPFQAQAGNWVFFWMHIRFAARDPITRRHRVVGTHTHLAMHTLGLDGVE